MRTNSFAILHWIPTIHNQQWRDSNELLLKYSDSADGALHIRTLHIW